MTAVAAFDASGAPLTSFGNRGLATFASGINATGAGTLGGIAPKSLHVGDIVLKAFGTVTPDGRVVIGTTNQAVAATTSSTLRRLLVPGASAAAGGSGTLLGSFGIVDGHLQKLTATLGSVHASSSRLAAGPPTPTRMAIRSASRLTTPARVSPWPSRAQVDA